MSTSKENFSLADIPVTSFGQFMLDSMRCHGDFPALIDGATDRTYTYKDIVTRTECVAAGLQRLGVKPRDVVAIIAPNHLDYPITFYATAVINAILQPLNPLYTPDDIKRSIGACHTQFIVTIGDLLPKVQEVLAEFSHIKVITLDGPHEGCVTFESLADPNHSPYTVPECDPKDDLVAFMSSSGTTGFPKAVKMTHYCIIANILQMNSRHFVKPGDSLIIFLPMFHAYGLYLTTADCHVVGAKVVIMSKFDPTVYLKLIETYKPSVLHVVPPIMVMFAKHPKLSEYDLSSVKTVVCGAAPLSQEIEDIVRERLKLKFIFQGFGMTEVGVTHLNTDEEWRHKSVGSLLPLIQVKVMDADTLTPVKTGEEGEIWIKGPQVCNGYLNLPEQTKNMFLDDGWVRTGDVGKEDKDGFLYIVDRLKELIKYKGFQVAPASLEDVILRHEAVADVGVVGVPDEEAGELPRAYVVKKSGKDLTTEELVEFVAKNVAPFMKLRGGVEFIDAIPKTASGKILRRTLREKARALVQK